MKNIVLFAGLLVGLTFLAFIPREDGAQEPSFDGAWQSVMGDTTVVSIVSQGYFAYAMYNTNNPEFYGTSGGSFDFNGSQITVVHEWNTLNPELIGENFYMDAAFDGNDAVTVRGLKWNRIDDGTPGALNGAWLITGRKRDDGEIRRSTPGVRRTMKILSGTRFQWIAYNVETKEFFGSGGGTYTTEGNKYVENIEVFSRDSTRVGASLEFNYNLVKGEWHHTGFSSKGDPMYEIWTPRKDVKLARN